MTEQIIQVERMEEAVSLFGSYDSNIRLLEQEYDVKVIIRDTQIKVSGEQPGVMTAVMGCDTVEHVRSNCALFNQTVTLTREQLDKLHNAFHGIDPRVINPGMWYNRT